MGLIYSILLYVTVYILSWVLDSWSGFEDFAGVQFLILWINLNEVSVYLCIYNTVLQSYECDGPSDTFAGIWVCRRQTGILPGCDPAAPSPPVPPSPSTPPVLPQTAPRPPPGRCWTEGGCSCRSPAGPDSRPARCWRESPGFGPKGRSRLRSRAAEPEEICAGRGARGASPAVAWWKKLRSTGSCCWICGRAAWRRADSHLGGLWENMREMGLGPKAPRRLHFDHFLQNKILNLWATEVLSRGFNNSLTLEHFFLGIFQMRGGGGTPGGKPT